MREGAASPDAGALGGIAAARPADASPPKAAAWLGGLGIVPFLALSVAAWTAPDDIARAAVQAVVAYGAVIVSFIGGAHWGFASAPPITGSSPRTGSILALSVLPSLAGWLALLLPAPGSLALLGVAFVAVLALDRLVMSIGRAPAWWMRLRLPLSATVAVLLFSAFLAVVLRLGTGASALTP